MKTKTFFFAAIAATMIFASCDENANEPGAPDQDMQPKSVTVKLANVKSPVPGRSTQAPVQNGSAAQLNTFTIFFVDGSGNFYEGYAADDVEKTGTPLTRTYTSTDAIPTFHYIDASVTKVIVVGNPTWQTEPANESALDAMTVAIASQQDVTNLVLVGKQPLSKKEGNEKDDVDGHTNVYEAKVSIVPLVARLEVGAFRYNLEDGKAERLYTSLSLNKLAINNYYGTCAYDNTVSDEVTPEITNATVWTYLNELQAGWFNDGITDITLNADNQYVNDKDFGAESSDQVFAYNVFAGDRIPQLILGMSGTTADVATAALYLATKGLGIDKLEAGYVYRMDIDTNANVDKPFQFEDGDLQNPDKCVDVEVTVTPWQVVYMTPEF